MQKKTTTYLIIDTATGKAMGSNPLPALLKEKAALAEMGWACHIVERKETIHVETRKVG